MKQLKFCYLFYILVIFSLNSCTSSDHKIPLDQTTSFQIPVNSKLIRIIQTDVDYFHGLTNQNLANQLILYKIITQPNCQIYIGVAIDLTNSQIHQQLISNKTYKLIDQKTTTFDSEAILLQIDSNRFCYHYIKEFKKGDKYLFSFIANDKDLLKEMFHSNIIEKSFINE
jgi:hypothetical protein